MNYETYWSILETPSKAIRSYDVCLCITLISLVAWLLIKKFKKSSDKIEKQILLWFTGILFTISISAFTYLKIYDKDLSFENTKKLMESNKVERIEGIISDFQNGIIASRKGVNYESFAVDSIKFSYSDELLGRFNSFGKTNDGVLRNGLPVRITYEKENHEILKIEIQK